MNKREDGVSNEQLIQMMDALIQSEHWNRSSFLKVLQKKLQEVRNHFARETCSEEKSTVIATDDAEKNTDKKEVFIILYSSEGENLQAWERILYSLPKQVLSRPIYTKEEDVYQLLRSKESRINEAYVSVYIDESDIIALGEKALFDRFGKSLLTLRDKAIQLENIHYFFHSTGQYRFVDGHLKKILTA